VCLPPGFYPFKVVVLARDHFDAARADRRGQFGFGADSIQQPRQAVRFQLRAHIIAHPRPKGVPRDRGQARNIVAGKARHRARAGEVNDRYRWGYNGGVHSRRVQVQTRAAWQLLKPGNWRQAHENWCCFSANRI